MAYTKTLWKTGDIVTQEKMNKIEQGIKSMELPSVTSEDDGKALVVDNGTWALGNASSGRGGSDLQIVKITFGQSGATCSHSRSDIEDMMQNEVPFIAIIGGNLCHIIPSQVGSFWCRELSSVNVQDKILSFNWVIFDVDNNKDVSIRLSGSEEVELQTTN